MIDAPEGDRRLPPLTQAQRSAVEHQAGPLIVLAGPGSGKTRVLIERIAHTVRVRRVPPERIVAVTYTTRAATQLRERLATLIGPAAQSVNAHTFHGLGLRLVRRFAAELGIEPVRSRAALALNADAGVEIMDSAQRKRLLRELVDRHGVFAGSLARGRDAIVADVSRHIDLFADHALTPDDVRAFVARATPAIESGRSLAGEPLDDRAVSAERVRLAALLEHARAAELFERACRDRGLFSFAQLISAPIALLGSSTKARALVRDEWRHFLVDEFQDVNAAQIALLARLAPPESNPDLAVVGDDDQAIYAFRGADERAFARFAAKWRGSTTVVLDENHRSTPHVVEVSSAVIGRAEGRFHADKALRSAKRESGDDPVELVMLEHERQDPEAIAALILLDRVAHPDRPWSKYAVIARNHADLSNVHAALELEGIPGVIQRSGSPLEDPGVQRVLAMVEALVDPRQPHALLTLLLRPPISAPVDRVQRVWRQFAASGFASEDQGSLDAGQSQPPMTFAGWLSTHCTEEPGVARLLQWLSDLAQVNALSPADQTLERIVHTIDAVHADLPEGRARAARVSAIVGLLGFVRARASRLEPPGDLRALRSYLEDLDPSEFAEADLSQRVDTQGVDSEDQFSGRDAVRLLTAHGSKGLEFDTVFVPRVSPRGYPNVRSDDDAELPVGLIDNLGDSRSRKQRCADEERRVFYVACSRAERRLVLLAKQNKSRSRSMHLLEEIRFDPACAKSIVVRSVGDLFEKAARLQLGSRDAIWRHMGGPAVPERVAFADRAVVLDRARRDARSAAAAALDRLENAVRGDPGVLETAVADSAAELAGAARRLAQVSAASVGGAEVKIDDRVLMGVIEQADTAARAAQDPDAAWHALVQQHAPHAPLTISYSALHQYVFCPRCYFVEHRLGLKSRSDPSQIVGLVVHKALHAHAERRRTRESEGLFSPVDLDIDGLLALGERLFRAAWPSDEAPDLAQLEQVRHLLRAAMALESQDSNIQELERSAVVPFGEHGVSVRIDRVDEITTSAGSSLRRIVDYKTGTPTTSKLEPADDDLQLCLYAMALRHLTEDPELDGVAEYWVLQEPARGSIRFADMKLAKVTRQVQTAIDGILAHRFERSSANNRFREHVCDLLGPLGNPER